MDASSLPVTCTRSSKGSTVPVAPCAITSVALPVALADWASPGRFMSGVDHAEAARRCAVDLPDDDCPDKLMPQVSRPVKEINVATKPATAPRVQWGQPRTDTAAPTASFQTSSEPLTATSASSRAGDASSALTPCGAPITSPSGQMNAGAVAPARSCQPGR